MRAACFTLCGWIVSASLALAQVPVVATTSLVADVVQAVGGERIALTVLIPPGTNPHTFEPTPRDLLALTRARLIFVHGLGLEEQLLGLLSAPEFRDKVVEVSTGIEPRGLEEEDHGVDPHVWLDPVLMQVWVDNVERALRRVDPEGAALFAQRAQAFRAQLQELHRELAALVEQVPPERRLLVTDHWALGYLAQRYGFVQVAALVSSFSSLAEPSARELAQLEDKIRALGVRALFVSPAFNLALAERVARDTGVRLVLLNYEWLEQGQRYPDWLRSLVQQIVEALAG